MNKENLITNLRMAASEAFRLYPDVYNVNAPTDETLLQSLSDGYGEYDGFYENGLEPDEVLQAVTKEWNSWVSECKESE